jgi:UDP-glucose 4-epimerase
LVLVEGELGDLNATVAAMRGQEWVFHFASNPDIAKAMVEPSVDFWQGTYLTQNLLEAARLQGVRYLVYASGSGVYGEVGTLAIHEDHAPMLPISTYGASKLACEALICAYCHLFEMQAYVYRFANVVGPRQTHGVAYDFIRKLRKDPTRLKILGDGTQSKSYVHASDIVSAIAHTIARVSEPYNYFNVAAEGYLDVRTIADMVCQEMGLTDVEYEFTGGPRGWKGDVPIVRFDLTKIHDLCWRASLSSLEAMRCSIAEMLTEF